MLLMVIERFRNSDVVPIYQKVGDGRSPLQANRDETGRRWRRTP